jgi:hypothetical protein
MCVLKRISNIGYVAYMKYESRPSICMEMRVKDLYIKIKDLYSIKCHKQMKDTF